MTPACDECGALVADEQKHADWHRVVVTAELKPGEDSLVLFTSPPPYTETKDN